MDWTINDINVHNIYQNGISNFEIKLRNMSAETFMQSTNNKLWSKTLSTMSNFDIEDNNHPIIHGKKMCKLLNITHIVIM